MRQLRHSPGFTVTAILTLATGIGAVVAMFSVYSRVVLNPVTVAEPRTLMAIVSVNRTNNFVPPSLSWPRFEAIRRGTSAFSQLAAYSTESVSLTSGDGPPEQLQALRVSGEFFGALRLQAARGRLLTANDDVPNGPAVCVLSHELWQTRFGGRELVGSTIRLDGKPTEVVGTLPPRMSPPWSDRQIFLPRVFDDSGLTMPVVMQGATFLQVVGRLRSGMTTVQAADQLRAVSRQYAIQFAGRGDAKNELEVGSFVDSVVGKRRPVMIALMAAVAVVLIVSCLNAAALVVSWLASRQRDTALRQALGASRFRIMGQFLLESSTLAGLAGAVGVLLAAGMLDVVQRTLAAELPPGIVLSVDRLALTLALAAVVFSATVIGVVPAVLATRRAAGSTVNTFIRGMSDGVPMRRFRSALVIAEVALSVFLLVGANLLLTSLVRLQRTSPGFDPSGVGAAFTSLPAERYSTAERQSAFFSDVLDRLKANSQVTGAAIVFGLPFHDENYASTYSIAGRTILPPADRARAGLRIVTEDYFAVMRMRLIQGRFFAATDRAGAPGVCIVNESLAHRQFGTQRVLGNVVLRGRDADQPYEIVGIVADVKTNGLRSITPDEVFYPFRQIPRANAAIVARTAGDPEALGPVIQAAVAAVSPDQPVSRFASMDRRLRGTLGGERVVAALTTGFAGIALILAAVGVYAVLAHNVSARTVEIGIRMAIGADRINIVRLILSQGMRLVALGMIAGVSSAMIASRFLATLLYEVSPYDPWAYGLVAATFVAVGIIASFAPAVRASRVDPLSSLNAT